MADNQKKSFYASLQTVKIDGKSILELAKSTDEVDQAKAIRGAKQIVKSILEAEVLTIDESGNITNIGHGEDIFALQKGLSKRLEKNVTNATFFDASKYEIEKETVDYDKIKINSLTETQEKTTTKTNEVQKLIEKTDKDLIYPGRGLVTFDPEKNLFTSRGKSIEIDTTTLKIKGLDIVFKDLQELIYAANLVNRFKEKYPGVKDFYFGSRLRSGMYYGIYHSESGLDTKIISLDTIKEKFPSILTAGNDVKDSFISYINAAT